MNTGGVNEIVEDARMFSERNTHHGIGQVPIECGEKPEAVFPGQIFATARTGVRNRLASRLSAELRLRLVNRDHKTAVNQFVRSA
jgi:hypothetical protein